MMPAKFTLKLEKKGDKSHWECKNNIKLSNNKIDQELGASSQQVMKQ